MKVQLLWTRRYSCPIKTLSLNLLREICTYLEQDLVFVPALCHDTFRLYNVRARTVNEYKLASTFTSGAVFCFTEGLEVIVVGGWSEVGDVFAIKTGVAEKLNSMCVARAWPGIYHWKSQTYVFGGNNPSSISSCEKRREGNWQPLPDMAYARYSFNPCRHQYDLWLPDLYQGHRVMESFSLEDEQFRLLPHSLPASDASNSIAYMSSNDELVVISESLSFYVWREGELCPQEHTVVSEGTIRAYCPCPLLCYGAEVYFSNFENGELGCFSREMGKMREITDFTILT